MLRYERRLAEFLVGEKAPSFYFRIVEPSAFVQTERLIDERAQSMTDQHYFALCVGQFLLTRHSLGGQILLQLSQFPFWPPSRP